MLDNKAFVDKLRHLGISLPVFVSVMVAGGATGFEMKVNVRIDSNDTYGRHEGYGFAC